MKTVLLKKLLYNGMFKHFLYIKAINVIKYHKKHVFSYWQDLPN